MMETIRKILGTIITALEPILVTIVDVSNMVVRAEKEVFNNVIEAENIFLENIFNMITENSRINNASKIYYLLLTLLDIFLIGTIIKGKIIYIPMDELIVYIIIFMLVILSTLNLFLKHSQFNEKLKLFSIAQVLIIIPIIVIYWIVSIEMRDFYLRDLDINQWSSIFNNMIIYFATCVIGIITLYKGKLKKNNNFKKKGATKK